MIICYFGDYLPDYARNRVLIKGLKENGVEILECRSEKSGLAKYWELYKKHKALKSRYDILIVGQSVKTRLVWLAKLLSSKTIVWDAFYSFYDKYVYDSRAISRWNPKAWRWWLVEWLACWLADAILLDTNEHIKYFSREFRVPKKKFIRALVGTDIEPDTQEITVSQHTNKLENVGMSRADIFLVHFHGKYIPLQGVKYIIEAAKILERHNDIKFNLIGSGQTFASDKKLADDLGLKNINFIGRVAFDDLVGLMQKADVCLGIFGNTPKTQRVIPNKVYEAAALAKPVITADTQAIKELFNDRQNILLCQAADLRDLADKILEIKNDHELCQRIAQGGYDIFRTKATPKVIAKELLVALENL